MLCVMCYVMWNLFTVGSLQFPFHLVQYLHPSQTSKIERSAKIVNG